MHNYAVYIQIVTRKLRLVDEAGQPEPKPETGTRETERETKKI